MASTKKMILGAQNVTYGSSKTAWKMKGANPSAYMDSDHFIHIAKWAEKGKFQFLFMADHPSLRDDLTSNVPSTTIDPIVVTSQIIRETKRIGVVLTQSTTFNLPYNVARQLKALDVLSGGRIGWNAVTTSDPMIAANYGSNVADRKSRYERAHEFIQIVQALWGSWGESALKLDVSNGIFADTSQIQPINLQGQHVASRGPLPIPPSPQGQPVIFQAGGGREGLELAASYSSGIYSIVDDVESGREHRQNLNDVCSVIGRDPDEVKIFMGINVTLGQTNQEALDRQMDNLNLHNEYVLEEKLNHLSTLVSVSIPYSQLQLPLSEELRAKLYPHPYQLHSKTAVERLLKGETPFEVIAGGITDFHRSVVGTPEQVADQLQELFEAGACDGFVIINDRSHDGLPTFVENVIPILQQRQLFHDDYEGETLREHLGVPYQYGRKTTQ
ncbi:NtaA/DmoA family FMN-dependent monooxygenase [Paenibacillus sp. ACRRY]|uniref:NtaA/DmoA family FMN-dependent monooxygenase n=1 Tax=Paenibacillus sp. ACRRY TaxID=2918208 RepID=UPI001EF3E5E6|nr:NtaA/DmoA family FMN-dependent monooxygenase [Paenibacillus sp. ACRRY]MCG7384504.1 NtaA/DmoA family FMN-dependent monooxygenase [Paenibacillus sp. ACRRY]